MLNRIAGLFAATLATTFILAMALAEELEAPQAMAAECRDLAQSGTVDSTSARRCIVSCGRINAAVNSAATDAALSQCRSAHAKVTQRDIATTTEQEGTRSPSPTPAATLQASAMADIEGVYLQSNRSGFRVRAEGRKDWQTYCNESARIETGNDEFARAVKVNDRVRFTGISYDPARANDRVTHCMAKSAVIL